MHFRKVLEILPDPYIYVVLMSCYNDDVNGGSRESMNKQEFVDRLRMALNGRVSPGLVMDNVNYYQD